ncbi:T9SS type A sorting domain-containing protein [bacterium SCSIO 12741]|nr:T9SS type A sorting domain-containing protein [bacterium SCSIO 12741]
MTYDGNGKFTGDGYGTLNEKTMDFEIHLNTAPPLNSRVSAFFTATYDAGSLIVVKSATDNRNIHHVLTTNLVPGDKVKIQDPVQSMMAMQTNRKCKPSFTGGTLTNDCTESTPGIIIARRALVLGENPQWIHFGVGNTREMVFSEDGNELFFIRDRRVLKITGLQDIYSQEDADNSNYLKAVFSLPALGTITGLVLNPKNPDELLVTVGNYGVQDHVYLVEYDQNIPGYKSKSVQGSGLPEYMPVYDAIFAAGNGDQVILATDLGVYSTSNIHASDVVWSKEDFGNIPVFDIDQQTGDHTQASNHGAIYLATHGRGIWKSETLVSTDEYYSNASSSPESGIKCFPNPVAGDLQVELQANSGERVTLRIYDLNGRMHQEQNSTLAEGEQILTVPTENLTPGTYLISVGNGQSAQVSRFVKIRP